MFLKIIFKENFVYPKNIVWMYTSGTPITQQPTGRHSIGRCYGRVTLAFLKVPCIIAIISTILSSIESYLALSYLL